MKIHARVLEKKLTQKVDQNYVSNTKHILTLYKITPFLEYYNIIIVNNNIFLFLTLCVCNVPNIYLHIVTYLPLKIYLKKYMS